MKNLPLKTKFILFTVSFILVFLSFISIYVLGTQKYNNYKNYNTKLQKIQIDYLDLRQSHQSFLNQYVEDESFFKTGKNKYLRQSELKDKSLIDQIENIREQEILLKINADIKLIGVTDNLENIDILINAIGQKLYRRGSKTTGIIGEMQRAYDYVLKNTDDSELLKQIYLLKQNENNYILTKDIIYYKQYLSTFVSIANYLSSNTLIYPASVNQSDSLNLINVKTNLTLSKTSINNLNKYKKEFIALVNIDKELGYTREEGLFREMQVEVDKVQPILEEIEGTLSVKIESIYKNNILISIISLLVAIIILIIIIIKFSSLIIAPVNIINEYILPLRKGILPKKQIEVDSKDEIAEISISLKKLTEGLKKTTAFAEEIGHEKFDTEYHPLSDEDVLGNSLLRMRQNLQEAKIKDEKREKEDAVRKWVSDGVTKFAEILRQTTKDLNELSNNVIKNLVAYLNANQGGVFLYNDDNKNDVYLELIASYAYNKERKKKKKILLGEGLIGTCAVEKAPIYMTDIPNDYITITSGLGGANPRSLFIIPLKLEDQVLGIIEIASFNKFEEHEREFIEKVTESIASTLSITKINQRTTKLLAQSQKQTEEMHAQEEEMRQNMEELKATQEESNRRELEMNGMINSFDKALLVSELNVDGYIIEANKTLLKFLGLNENKYIGHSVVEFTEEDNIFMQDEFIDEIRKGNIYRKISKTTINFKTLYFDEYYSAVFDQYNAIEKIICISYNITDSVLNKSKLDEIEKELENKKKLIKKQVKELQTLSIKSQREIEQLEKDNKRLREQEENLKTKLKKNLKTERKLIEDVNKLNIELTEYKK